MCASVGTLTDRTGHRHAESADAHARRGTLPQPMQMERGQGNVHLRRRSPCLISDAPIRGAERRASRRAGARGILRSWGESTGGTTCCCNIVVQRALARARPWLHQDLALHRLAQGPRVRPLQLQLVTRWPSCRRNGRWRVSLILSNSKWLIQEQESGVRAPRANAQRRERGAHTLQKQSLTLASRKVRGKSYDHTLVEPLRFYLRKPFPLSLWVMMEKKNRFKTLRLVFRYHGLLLRSAFIPPEG